jgi:hypothetical protein
MWGNSSLGTFKSNGDFNGKQAIKRSMEKPEQLSIGIKDPPRRDREKILTRQFLLIKMVKALIHSS